MVVLLLLLALVSVAHSGKVGILYEGWHAYAVAGMNEVAAQNGKQLTMEDVIRSDGQYAIADIYDKYGISPEVYNSFFYQSTPEAGYYCIYAKRANETGWGVPDCANITETLTRHAKMLVAAGIDFVAVDGTNIPTMSAQGDVLQLRPMEILFQEWAALRAAGIPTPQIAAWSCLPTGATLWQNYLDLYNTPVYADLVMNDTATGKQVMFATDNPDPNLIQQVEANGARNNVVVQPMWAEISAQAMQSGMWTFFSPCVQNGAFGSSVVGVQCQQVVSTNAKIGAHGTQMAVSPSYQMSYGSLPFVAPGKLAGLTFKTQFYNAFAAQPDYLFISSFNEYIAQPQANPFTSIPTAFDMGLPNDPAARSLYVDSYGWEFSRDIEPSLQGGSYIYDIMSSCVAIFKSGATTCNDANAVCCQSSDFFVNVYSMESNPSIGYNDFIVSISPAEVNQLISENTYYEICTPFGGTTVFCNGNPANPQTGPFIIYTQSDLYPGLVALYRCMEGNTHFISTQSDCEGQKTESLLGYLSPIPGRETYRALYRCLSKATGAHYHSIDLACPASDSDTGLLGYVR